MIRDNRGIFLTVIILAIAAVLLCCVTSAKAAPVENYDDGARWTDAPVVVLSTYPVQPCRLTGEQIDEI